MNCSSYFCGCGGAMDFAAEILREWHFVAVDLLLVSQQPLHNIRFLLLDRMILRAIKWCNYKFMVSFSIWTIYCTAGKGASAAATGFLDPKGEEFAKLKERILLLERVLLHTIGFELSIDHPYKFLVEQIKKMIHNRQLEYITPPTSSSSTSQTMSKMLNELVQYSMNFANDALHCSLCLQFSPHMIATACVYLAGHFAKVKPTHNKSWLEVSGCPDTDADALSSICVQIIELIVDRRGSDNTAFQTIRDDLDKMRGIVGSASPRAVAGSTSPRPPSSQRPPPPPAAAAAAPARPPPPTAGEQPAKRPRTSS